MRAVHAAHCDDEDDDEGDEEEDEEEDEDTQTRCDREQVMYNGECT